MTWGVSQEREVEVHPLLVLQSSRLSVLPSVLVLGLRSLCPCFLSSLLSRAVDTPLRLAVFAGSVVPWSAIRFTSRGCEADGRAPKIWAHSASAGSKSAKITIIALTTIIRAHCRFLRFQRLRRGGS